MINRLVALSLAVLGATIFVPSAHAQRHGGFASAPAARTGTSLSGRRGMRTGFAHLRRSRRFAGGGSDFAPYYYSDYDYEPGMSEAPPPQIIERAVEPAPPAPPPAPGLVLELQGDHWVRISNYGESQTAQQPLQPEFERASKPPSPVPPANPHRTQAAEPPSQLPPAVLVFRDGHEEEIGKYLIVGATIYTSSDYWSSGSWTRKVQMVDLDVPATLKLNQERGAKFTLPSGPSEVMVRP